MGRILFFSLIVLVLDFYSWQAFKAAFPGNRKVKRAFWLFSLLVYLVIIAGTITDFYLWKRVLSIYTIGFIFVVYVSKLLIVFVLLFEDITRLLKVIVLGFLSVFRKKGDRKEEFSLSRSRFLNQTGIIIGGLTLGLFSRGMISGMFNFTTRSLRLSFKNLPAGFHGFRIVQISDLHLGTFYSSKPLERAVEQINALRPDVIFFTGDLVNTFSEETKGFTEILGSLNAPLGVYSILGNHDYGDYHRWENDKDKKENFVRLKEIQASMGWRLLTNEHAELLKNGEKITLIGVENWGRGRFSRYGDMERSTKNIPDNPFTVLLSHDPSHWTYEISKRYPFVDLTFSGHTHGMQFGLDLPGMKWSPAKYFYKHWMGLYREGDQYLYVNRGIGSIGYPGRIGVMPEITLVELFKS
jgi:uncharacterized protein